MYMMLIYKNKHDPIDWNKSIIKKKIVETILSSVCILIRLDLEKKGKKIAWNIIFISFFNNMISNKGN